MDDATRPLVGWRDLAGAIPGAVGVGVGGELAYVSAELVSLVDRERSALVGRPWRTLFDAAATRVEDAVADARSDGRWHGTVRLADGRPVELTLSTGDGDVVVGVLEAAEPHVREPDDPATGRDARLYERPTFVRRVLDAVEDVLYVIDEDGESYLWNETLVETTGYSHEELDSMHPMELIPPDQHEYVPGLMEAITETGDRRVEVDILTKDGERITHEFGGTTFEDTETGEAFRCGVARDVSDRLERQRTLERQRDELATLDRINELLLETTREAIGTASREAVEAVVCERLANSALYRFAWVGEPAFDGDWLVPRATAGEADGYLDDVTITTDGAETGRGPAGRAMATGEVQVTDVDDPSFEPWREAARERGFESVAAVPLQDDGTVYGVLVVYATREGAFSDREQSGFDVLGRTVGAVIHAAKNRELLFADAVVELEFRVADDDLPYVAAAAALECDLELEGYVSSGERWVLYLEVEGAPAADFVDALAGDPRIDRGRVLEAGEAGGRVEMVVPESSLLDAVTASGAIVRTASVDANGVDVRVEAPVDAEIREVGEHVREEFADAELLACRHRDREVTHAGQPGGPLDELTQRQREVLEVAYRAGYFSWPRDSTAEEVAGSLDLAPPTLHAHLRKAEEAILSRLFESG